MRAWKRLGREMGAARCSALHTLAVAAAVTLLTACGGGGGGGGDGGEPTPVTYTLSGTITSSTANAGIAGVRVDLTGARTSSTTTDATGSYHFGSLPNGSYVVTPTLSGMAFQPASQAVTISNANAAGINFVALAGGAVATGIQFLPEWFSSANQLRASLLVRGSHVYFTDSSASPLKRAALDGSGVSSLADRFRGARNVLVRGGEVYWVDASQLKRTPLAGGATTVLAEGSADHGEGTTADIAVDDSYAYWVNSVDTLTCSPPCTWVIQKVPLAGGAPVTLATVNRKVAALAADATRVFWEENSLEPLDPGCDCGSKVKSIAKVGGAVTVLVDGSLNGTLPAPPPGYIAASWLPTGGLALTASEVVFARAGNAYEIMAIPLAGGTLRTLASVSTPDFYSTSTLQGLALSGSNVYFIDNYNHALSTVPLAGGAVTAVVTSLGASTTTGSSVLALDGGNAYWSELGSVSGCCITAGTGVIRRVSLSGGAAVTVVGGLDLPGSVSLDGANLAWTEAWRVGKATSSGANRATLASGIAADMARIAADASNVYVLDGSFIKKIPLGGGQAEKLAYTSTVLDDQSLTVQDIATDGSSVYWTTTERSVGADRAQGERVRRSSHRPRQQRRVREPARLLLAGRCAGRLRLLEFGRHVRRGQLCGEPRGDQRRNRDHADRLPIPRGLHGGRQLRVLLGRQFQLRDLQDPGGWRGGVPGRIQCRGLGDDQLWFTPVLGGPRPGQGRLDRQVGGRRTADVRPGRAVAGPAAGV